MKKILLFLTIAFSLILSSCEFADAIEEVRRLKYEDINKIEKNSEYALIMSQRYVSSTEEIDFANMIKEKVLNEKHKIEEDNFCGLEFYGDLVSFAYQYDSKNRFFGLNDLNNYWAVGTISLDDYSIEIHYIISKYEKISILNLSKTHFCLSGKDENAEKETDQNGKEIIKYDYFILDRSNEKWLEFDDYSKALEAIGEEIEEYKSPDTFSYDGKTYTLKSDLIISNSIIYDENGEEVVRLSDKFESFYDLFDNPDIVLNNKELKKICEIIGENTINEIEGFLFTNGEDLFIGIRASMTLFGPACSLIGPVIFKTTLDFDSFEYVGCANDFYRNNFFYKIQIKKIK